MTKVVVTKFQFLVERDLYKHSKCGRVVHRVVHPVACHFIREQTCKTSHRLSSTIYHLPYHVCTFYLSTADTDSECANYNHPTHGQVGSCVSTSQCPYSNYISNLCPTKAADVKCCFSKPSDTCSGGKLFLRIVTCVKQLHIQPVSNQSSWC